jgi:integrase
MGISKQEKQNRPYRMPRAIAGKNYWKQLKSKTFGCHDLRRNLGSYQTITGASLQIIGKLLGHRSPEAT